DERGM
ncbi:hypothetical protein ACHAW6_001181, partial [Cyclotella cf. meneghiniana]